MTLLELEGLLRAIGMLPRSHAGLLGTMGGSIAERQVHLIAQYQAREEGFVGLNRYLSVLGGPTSENYALAKLLLQFEREARFTDLTSGMAGSR